MHSEQGTLMPQLLLQTDTAAKARAVQQGGGLPAGSGQTPLQEQTVW